MNEAEDRPAILLAKQAVVIGETAAILGHFADEGVRLLILVMQVHLDVADAEPHDFGDGVQKIATVLLLRVEEAVLRALAVGIAGSIVGDARPPIAPASDSGERSFDGGAHAEGFVMVGDGNPEALRLWDVNSLSQPVFQVWQEPDSRLSREVH